MLRCLFVLSLLAVSAWGQGRNAPRGKAGEFDFYLLSLSWSPQYCASPAGARDNMQCGGQRQYEFVLHGLWPQYEKSWPQFCETGETLGNPLVEKMLDIMPSRRLIRHEWEKHGVCAGMSAADYFGKARAAFGAVKIPASLKSPKTARRVAPVPIRDEVLAATPGTPKEAVTVGCGGGRFLSEIRVCLGKDLKARACSAEVQRQSCRAAEVIVQPLR
ncbi:MAG TPA: ribonuclease T2 [Bryobacteraceae bacterium]|nr:ribonuclease T2 [Bryobacteraceae bacterium]